MCLIYDNYMYSCVYLLDLLVQAWENEQKSCCLADAGLHDALYPCPQASCPIKTKAGLLPANPFMAALINGRCKCVPPQVCDE